MIDRDKVISRLQIIRTWADVGKKYNGIQGEDCLRDVVDWIDDALALLKEKEQEPVKPVPAIADVGDWLCGNCYQSVVGEEELDASGFVPVKFNFCPNCGRAVKWE